MREAHEANIDQAVLWNGSSGEAWAELQSVLDEMWAPFERVLIEHGVRAGTDRVLDIGCGSGATTLAAAKRLHGGGSCLGVDLSSQLIETARRRAMEEKVDNAVFARGDAQTHVFEPESFDAVISRFGVMFFGDPVAAFVNIHGAARSGAVLALVVWRGPADNPFMTTAARAAAPFLPTLATPDPSTPGQFGFADPERVRQILESSRWTHVDIRPLDVSVSLTERDLRTYVTRLGPVGRALQDVDERTREQASAAVHGAFDSFVIDGTARFDAACWLVRARA
jgi:SAM-dependent methyltransferase